MGLLGRISGGYTKPGLHEAWPKTGVQEMLNYCYCYYY